MAGGGVGGEGSEQKLQRAAGQLERMTQTMRRAAWQKEWGLAF